MVGIGGGGDVVGSYAVALAAVELGTPAIVGGLTWERRPVDPIPGPRRLDEIHGAEPLNAAVALCGPDTTGPAGFRFCESHLSRLLGQRTVLVDPNPGPRATGEAIADAARQHARPDPGDRRQGRRESAPDVTFRWRSEARAPRARATAPRRPRG